jgi:hypothetical protein
LSDSNLHFPSARQHLIAIKIGKQLVELEVTYTDWGEVQAIRNPLDQLPQSALKLMFGEGVENVFQQLDRHAKLIPYKIPLVAIGLLNEEGYERIQAAFEEKPLSQSLKNVQSEWVRTIYSSYRHNDPTTVHQLSSLTEILRIQRTERIIKQINNLSQQNFKPLAPVLLALIEAQLDAMIVSTSYRALLFFPSIEHKRLLISHFRDPSRKRYRPNILNGLMPYDTDDVCLMALDHYDQVAKSESGLLLGLLRVFKKYRSKEVIQIGLTEIVNKNFIISQAAREVLIFNKVPEKKLAKVLRPVFNDEAKIEHLKSVVGAYTDMKSTHLLPPVEKLMDAMLRYSDHSGFDQQLIAKGVALIEKKYTPALDKKIFALLGQDANTHKRIGLTIIESLMSYTRRFSVSNENFERLLLLMNDKNPTIQLESLNTIARVLSIKPGKKEWVAPLLDKVESTTNDRMKALALASINHILWQDIKDPAVVPLGLSLLDHESLKIRRLAVQSLQFHIDLDERIRPALKALEKDADLKYQLDNPPMGAKATTEWKKKEHRRVYHKADQAFKEVDQTMKEIRILIVISIIVIIGVLILTNL